jgi:transglutaminase-like putative cysteine protease
MLLHIEHTTVYTYSEPIYYTIQQLRLTPQQGFGQHVSRWEIKVHGNLHEYTDSYGNITHSLVIEGEHEEITIVAKGLVETGLDYVATEDIQPRIIYLRDTALTASNLSMREFAQKLAPKGAADEKLIMTLIAAVADKVKYQKGSTEVDTTAITAFELGLGVCQDQTHVFIACCRVLGIPARYVSGYLFTEDGSLMQSHAWADVWLENIGWQSYDVSNAVKTNGKHVRLASGLDYRDASPVNGMRMGGGKESMTASVKVSQTYQQAQQ